MKEPDKKTTIVIPADLHRRARIRAAETDVDFRTVVIRALEEFLSRPAKKRGQVVLRTMTGLLAVLLSASAAAQEVHIGAGSQSCGQWVEARRGKADGDAVRTGMMTSWVQGFLIGTSIAVADERTADEIVELIAAGKMDSSNEAMVAFRQKKFGTKMAWAFDPPDSAAVQVWVDKYCSANPLQTVMIAAANLASELRPADSATLDKPKRQGKP